MGPKEEPAVLALLLGLAAVLYAVTWLLAGPPGSPEAPAVPSTAPAAEEVTLSAHPLGPELLAGLH